MVVLDREETRGRVQGRALPRSAAFAAASQGYKGGRCVLGQRTLYITFGLQRSTHPEACLGQSGIRKTIEHPFLLPISSSNAPSHQSSR